MFKFNGRQLIGYIHEIYGESSAAEAFSYIGLFNFDHIDEITNHFIIMYDKSLFK